MKKVINIGCGITRLTDYFYKHNWEEIRLDIDPAVNPDIIADMRDLEHLQEGYYDAVFSSHTLEHLETHEVIKTLIGWNRLIKEDGFLFIALPNLLEIAKYVVEDRLYDDSVLMSPAGPIAPIDMIFGYRVALAGGNKHMAHRTGFTPTSIGYLLLQSGFQYCKATGGCLDIMVVAYKNKPDIEDLDLI